MNGRPKIAILKGLYLIYQEVVLCQVVMYFSLNIWLIQILYCTVATKVGSSCEVTFNRFLIILKWPFWKDFLHLARRLIKNHQWLNIFCFQSIFEVKNQLNHPVNDFHNWMNILWGEQLSITHSKYKSFIKKVQSLVLFIRYTSRDL